MITDLAPVDRRGEAVSYWSVAVYGGLVVRPGARRCAVRLHGARSPRHYGRVWAVSAALAFVAAVLGLFTVEVERDARADAPRQLFHRAAIEPGTVLFLGLDRARRLHRVRAALRRRSSTSSAGLIFCSTAC